MKNLDKFESNSVDLKKMENTKGGNFWWGAVAGGAFWDVIKWMVVENNEVYGRHMYRTGSPGGAK